MGEPTTGSYPGFEGRVGRVFATSEPSWPPQQRPGAGAPNIVVVLADDLGFADLGCYGSEIPTPNLDRLAAEGLRFTNYHSTPMCSPTRAALLTGLEPHSVGMGHVAHSDPGFPGYAMELTRSTATLAEVLRAEGYATLMCGKWHLTKDSEQHDAADRSSWPLARGFDRFYGFLDGFTNLHHPHRLIEDQHAVRTDSYPDGYHLTEDLTDRAIEMVRSVRAADPTRPFLLYLAHAAVHAPLHAPAELIAEQRGRYDEGWDVLRERRFRRQIQLGLLPEGTVLPPRNHEPGDEVPAWDALDADHQRFAARLMEVYAAMVVQLDRSIGRLRLELERLGVWDNTLVVFTSDNGGSREGEADGTAQYLRTLHWGRYGMAEPFHEDLARIDELGGPTTMPHYPRGWAMVSNTPFRLYKINAHRGGHSVPLIWHWPAGTDPGERGSVRRSYAHVSDLFPTLLDLVGAVRPPAPDGSESPSPMGRSLIGVLADDRSPMPEPLVLIECGGQRGLQRGRFVAVTRHEARTPFSGDRWELYDHEVDPTEADDLADRHPALLAELTAEWERLAWRYQVFPLDEGTGYRYVLRPPWEERFERAVVIPDGTPTLDGWRSRRLILWRDVVVRVRFDADAGAAGVLVAHGDQGGGYQLDLTDGRLRFVHNGYGVMTRLDLGPAPVGVGREVEVRLGAAGGNRWDVEVAAGAAGSGLEVVGGADGLRAFVAMAPFEGIDVGICRRSPVDWQLFERLGVHRFTGRLHEVAYLPGPPAADAPVHFLDLLREWGARYE